MEHVVSSEAISGDMAGTIFTVLYVFILYNIPTAVFVGIYYACHEEKFRHILKNCFRDLTKGKVRLIMKTNKISPSEKDCDGNKTCFVLL